MCALKYYLLHSVRLIIESLISISESLFKSLIEVICNIRTLERVFRFFFFFFLETCTKDWNHWYVNVTHSMIGNRIQLRWKYSDQKRDLYGKLFPPGTKSLSRGYFSFICKYLIFIGNQLLPEFIPDQRTAIAFVIDCNQLGIVDERYKVVLQATSIIRKLFLPENRKGDFIQENQRDCHHRCYIKFCLHVRRAIAHSRNVPKCQKTNQGPWLLLKRYKCAFGKLIYSIAFRINYFSLVRTS